MKWIIAILVLFTKFAFLQSALSTQQSGYANFIVRLDVLDDGHNCKRHVEDIKVFRKNGSKD